MSPFLKYIGLVNIFLFLTVIAFLFKKSDKIDPKKNTISNLADDKKTAFLFNLSLLIFSIGQVIFSFVVNYSLTGKVVNVPMKLFISGGIFLALASIFTTKNHKIIHGLTSGISALFVGSGVVILSLTLFSKNSLLGTLTLIGSLLIPISYILSIKLRGVYWEFVLLGGVVIWNIVFSIPLLFPSVIN